MTQSTIGAIMCFGGLIVGFMSLYGLIFAALDKKPKRIKFYTVMGFISTVIFFWGMIKHDFMQQIEWAASHITVSEPVEKYQLDGKNPVAVKIEDGQVMWLYQR